MAQITVHLNELPTELYDAIRPYFYFEHSPEQYPNLKFGAVDVKLFITKLPEGREQRELSVAAYKMAGVVQGDRIFSIKSVGGEFDAVGQDH